MINTNNVIVNAILNTKYQEMTDKGIVFAFRVNDLSKIGISNGRRIFLFYYYSAE